MTPKKYCNPRSTRPCGLGSRSVGGKSRISRQGAAARGVRACSGRAGTERGWRRWWPRWCVRKAGLIETWRYFTYRLGACAWGAARGLEDVDARKAGKRRAVSPEAELEQ